uniref:Uncharacterized protein n=1 Tax=viral metagenome TaxID=1070528 RepID=A0A6M3LG25_9ZZZZ
MNWLNLIKEILIAITLLVGFGLLLVVGLKVSTHVCPTTPEITIPEIIIPPEPDFDIIIVIDGISFTIDIKDREVVGLSY